MAALAAAALLLPLRLGLRLRWEERPARREGAVEWQLGPIAGSQPLPLPAPLPLSWDRLDDLAREALRWVREVREHVPEIVAGGVTIGGARLERLEVRVQVGAGDAAATAVACGLVHAALWPALALAARAWRFRGRPLVVVQPDFSPLPAWIVEGHCIWSWRLGHLIAALGRMALARLARAAARWVQRLLVEVRPS